MRRKFWRVIAKAIDKFFSTVNFSCFVVTLALIAVFMYGTFGAFRLRGQITGIQTVHDAFYFAVVSMTTLGDGSMYPITSKAKSFVLSLLFFGFTTFATFISVVFYQIFLSISSYFNKGRGKAHMKNHIILCGYSLVAELVIGKLIKAHTPFVLIDNVVHPELTSGETGNFIYASIPSKQENLIKANINLCRAVIAASNSDSDNILAGINAGKLRKQQEEHFEIIVRILFEENIDVTKNNGADYVISPTLMEANAIAAAMESFKHKPKNKE
jgi:voltage-gated potassium channel